MPGKRARIRCTREAVNARRARWFREMHSFASVCVVFFLARCVAHPSIGARKKIARKKALLPPKTRKHDVFPTEKLKKNEEERGILCLGLVAFCIPREGLKTHRT